MLRRRTVTPMALFTVLVVAAIIPATRANKPESEGIDSKPSNYAPAKDLVAQVDDFMNRIEKDLASEAEYGEDQQDRVVKNGNTLAVIALVLSNHDDEVSLRAPARRSSIRRFVLPSPPVITRKPSPPLANCRRY